MGAETWELEYRLERNGPRGHVCLFVSAAGLFILILGEWCILCYMKGNTMMNLTTLCNHLIFLQSLENKRPVQTAARPSIRQ